MWSQHAELVWNTRGRERFSKVHFARERREAVKARKCGLLHGIGLCGLGFSRPYDSTHYKRMSILLKHVCLVLT